MKPTTSMADGKHIVMLGARPNADSRGGIAAVINVYRAAGLFARWHIEYIATASHGTALAKIRVLAAALVHFLWLLGSGRVAIVHAHSASRASFWRKSIFILLAIAMRKPTILHLHGGKFEHFYRDECGAVRKALVRSILTRVDRVVVLSPRWKHQVQAIAPDANVLILFNPVVVTPVRNADRTSSNVLLFLGRLTREKGLFDLLEAIAIIQRRFPNVVLRCGGEGDSAVVKDRANELRIAERVELLGWLSGTAKQRALSEAAVYVLPSYAEGLPMAVLEAMAAGIPVVCTCVGGIPDAIEDGVEGFLVEPGDVNALADRIERLLRDVGLRDEFGLAAWTKAKKHFSTEHVIAELEALYEELGAFPRVLRNCTEEMGAAGVHLQE
jgi:glycosyltransferase involved in cell wall biosynthesis